MEFAAEEFCVFIPEVSFVDAGGRFAVVLEDSFEGWLGSGSGVDSEAGGVMAIKWVNGWAFDSGSP